MEMTFKDWKIEELTGYKPQTTFYMDFSIADKFGKGSIIDTYNRAFESWNEDYKFMTELTMTLNWKIWEHYENGNNELTQLYNDLWEKQCEWCENNLKGEELKYYYITTD